MNKSQVRTLMCVLCLAALCALIAGCEGQATCPKAKEAKEAKATSEQAKPAAEKPKAASEPAKAATAEKPKEAAKPAAEKPKEAAAEKGPALGPYALAKNWMDEEGFINNWLLVGPFPNPGERPDNNGFNLDYLKNYGGELNHVPANGMEIKTDDGTAVKWQPYQSTDTVVNFYAVEQLKLEPSQEDILCYAACWVDSDADKEVELRIGSDDGYKLWVNHKLVSEQNVYRAMEMDQETHKVKLNKGRNLILVKVATDWGEFQFMLRVVNAEGKEVPGIKVWN
ncbi:MAG: hypothetical protein MUO27_09845 [Sedimentisphaerales bacterium]|nr:hypothetical protein [Sedimentisphaerales bacterium]